MERDVRYCTTEDGVRIAYWTMGTGMPLVLWSPLTFSHVALEWHRPELRAWYERLADTRTIIRYDPRGMGMSQRGVPAYNLAAGVCDVDAVVSHTGVERHHLALFGLYGGIGLAYAARFPERVSRLVLVNAAVRPGEAFRAPAFQGLNALVRTDWRMYTDAFAHAFTGWSHGRARDAEAWASLIRESVTQGDFIRMGEAMEELDFTALLPQVAARTLIIGQSGRYAIPDQWQEMASQIPGARLVQSPRRSADAPDDPLWILRTIEEFLAEEDPPSKHDAPTPRGAVQTILFTDLVGHTEMMQRLGDAKGRDVLREHERITRETLKQHGGAEIKTMGDGFMASFGSVTSAMECAIALQRAFAARNDGNVEPLQVRVGLNAGEPIEEDGDLFGSTVILASRIAAKAGAGEILIPEPVRHLLSGKPFVYADGGEFVPKGFDDAVRLYEVRWQEEA